MNTFGTQTAEARADSIYQFAAEARIPAYIVEKDFFVNDRCFPAVMTIRNRHGLLKETNGRGMHWLPPTGANKLTAGGSPNRC